MTVTIARGLIAAAAIAVLLTGYVTGVQSWPLMVDEHVEEVRDTIKGVPMYELREAIEKGDYDVIIDVREAEEYAAGHIPGAINIPRGMLEFEIWKHVGDTKADHATKKIYVYCQDGRRAILCAKTLEDLGFSNVGAIMMELDEWAVAGEEMATGAGSVQF